MKKKFTALQLCVILLTILIVLIAKDAKALNAKEMEEIYPILEEVYPVLGALRGIELHGIVDTGYNYNINKPDNSDFRVYDVKHDSMTLHMVELSISKDVEESDYAGFRFDLHFGKDANVNAPADTRADDEIDVEEAFIVLQAPVGEGVNLKVGKFVALMGMELIENPLNWNYSRSFIFKYGPFTHVGALASYSVGDMISFTGGIVNGWDVIEDNNENKSFMGSIAYSMDDLFSLTVSGIIGPEQNNVNTDKADETGLIGAVATFSPIKQLTLAVDSVYGEQDDGVKKGDGAVWKGIAGYIHYDALEWLGFTTRFEYFSDDDGNRTGIAQELKSTTFTTEFRPADGLITRVEYRIDLSNKEAFTRGANSMDVKEQQTFGVEIAYGF